MENRKPEAKCGKRFYNWPLWPSHWTLNIKYWGSGQYLFWNRPWMIWGGNRGKRVMSKAVKYRATLEKNLLQSTAGLPVGRTWFIFLKENETNIKPHPHRSDGSSYNVQQQHYSWCYMSPNLCPVTQTGLLLWLTFNQSELCRWDYFSHHGYYNNNSPGLVRFWKNSDSSH